MLLDGELLSADESSPVGEYVAYYKEIQHGFHQVRTQDGVATRIAVQVYGHGPSSYGYTAYGMPADYIGECVCVCVCALGKGRGGHPICTDTRRVMKI